MQFNRWPIEVIHELGNGDKEFYYADGGTAYLVQGCLHMQAPYVSCGSRRYRAELSMVIAGTFTIREVRVPCGWVLPEKQREADIKAEQEREDEDKGETGQDLE